MRCQNQIWPVFGCIICFRVRCLPKHSCTTIHYLLASDWGLTVELLYTSEICVKPCLPSTQFTDLGRFCLLFCLNVRRYIDMPIAECRVQLCFHRCMWVCTLTDSVYTCRIYVTNSPGCKYNTIQFLITLRSEETTIWCIYAPKGKQGYNFQC